MPAKIGVVLATIKPCLGSRRNSSVPDRRRRGLRPLQASRASRSSAKIDRMSQKRQVILILIIQALLVLIVAVAVGFEARAGRSAGRVGVESPRRLGDPFVGRAHHRRAGRGGLCRLRRPRAAPSQAVSLAAFEAACLAGLLFAAVGIQVIVPMGAPAGYDLTKWASVNYLPGSTGYFQIARQKAADDPWKFLAEYPDWIRTQDVFHIGTHPPGLIAAQCLLLRTMEQSPRLTGCASGSYASLGRGGLSGFWRSGFQTAIPRPSGRLFTRRPF